jgi:hypothetical protein
MQEVLTRTKTCENRFTEFNNMFLKRYGNYYTNIKYVEFGVGHTPFCLYEFRKVLEHHNFHIHSTGIDIDSSCIKLAKRMNKDSNVKFITGGVLDIPPNTNLIRCFNVFRQSYKPKDFYDFLCMLKKKNINGLLFEGTSRSVDELNQNLPNFYIVNVFEFGNGTYKYVETIFGRDVSTSISPMEFQGNLPRMFIEKMKTDSEISTFMKKWNQIWETMNWCTNHDEKWLQTAEILQDSFSCLEIHLEYVCYTFNI